MTHTVVNLDCVSFAELVAISGDESQHKAIRAYAAVKRGAINARLSGDIAKACELEGNLDRMYSQRIPAHLRW